MPSARAVTTVAEALSLFPSDAAIAADLGVDYRTVLGWRRRGRIPEHAWDAVVRAARGRGIGLTRAKLASLPSALRVTSCDALLRLWPERTAVATDLGVPLTTVASWAARDRIPLEWWDALIASGKNHGIRNLTREVFYRIAVSRLAARPGNSPSHLAA